MSSLFGIGAGSASTGFYPETIDQSLRFDGSSSYLTKTPSSDGNRRKWTFSAWIKFAQTDDLPSIFGKTRTGNNREGFAIGSSQKLQYQLRVGSTTKALVESEMVLRDTTNFYHIMMIWDSDNATASNRVIFYVNGQNAGLEVSTTPVQNTDSYINSTNQNYIGWTTGGTNYLHGYMAEVNFVDGQALAPSSFGETKNGVWIPKEYSASYGGNGFRLTFADSSNLGDDISGNGNDYTSNGLASTDVVPDSPENNFATLLGTSGSWTGTLQEGNLSATVSGSNNWSELPATFGVSSGKWYFEAVQAGSNAVKFNVGIIKAENYHTSSGGDGHTTGSFYYYGAGYFYSNGSSIDYSYGDAFGDGEVVGIAMDLDNNTIEFYNENVSQGSKPITADTTYLPFIASYSASSVTKVNFGGDSSFSATKTSGSSNASDGNGKGDFYYSPPSGFLALCSSNLPDTTISPNQDTQADDHFNTVLYTGNGYPTSDGQTISGVGFQPDWTWIKDRSRSGYNHYLLDSNRGATKVLRSNVTNAEGTEGTSLTSWNGDGFVLGANNEVNYQNDSFVAWNWKAGGTAPTKTYKVVVVSDSGNKYRFRNSADSATFAQSAVTLDLQEGGTYVFDWSDSTAQGHPIRFSTTSDGTHGGGSEYTTGVVKDDSAYTTTITVASSAPQLYYYCSIHSGMGGSVSTNSTFGSTNFDGDILSVVQTNLTAGFSILTFSGNGDNTNNEVGHGLGVKPAWYIVKDRDTNSNGHWMVYHQGITNPRDNVFLNLNNSANAQGFGSTDPATTTTLKPSVTVYNNVNGNDYICYAFSEIKGYSKFGSFVGNSSADGVYVHLGFRPRMIIWKDITTSSEAWLIVDTARDTNNPVTKLLFPSDASAEYDSSPSYPTDFVSNGFKVRNASFPNNSSRTYIYMAWSDGQTEKFSNAR